MDAMTARALLQRYLDGDASQEEIILIEQWYHQMAGTGEQVGEEDGVWKWEEGERQRLETTMERRLLEKINLNPPAAVPPVHENVVRETTPMYRTMGRLAVAVVLLMVVTGTYLLLLKKQPMKTASVQERYQNDVRPGQNSALLKLTNGKTILLDDSAPRTIPGQGSVTITNDKGQLTYRALAENPAETFYNTLTTAKGNQYHLVLPDGTKVWLNAASSITYPTVFTGKERQVDISGEAYFEVAKNQRQPFVVRQGELTVQVLGTSFDANCYGDDAAGMITLLEGKVRVEKGTARNLLEPGQQAVVRPAAGSIITILRHPDIEAVMAWKNGSFGFNDADIGSVMREVERWYNVQVVYEAIITSHFVANIPRSAPLSQLLQLLEATGQVHFRIEGKKVIVMQ
jgi:ferric-dicitrate binding protein FerR (iron transport regulator)